MDEKWKQAEAPNYETNKDKLYPYSETPFDNEHQLVKIPFCVKNLIEHVDYFGCGRIETASGTIGFPGCYNVNGEYNLVLEGPDTGRKIPNRIPMADIDRLSYCTRNYIKDNSVHTVTVNLKICNMTKTIPDIARVVNSEWGRVIVYGYREKQNERLADELMKMKQLFYCPIYMLPDNLRLTYWNTCYSAYLSINELKRELYRNVNKGDIEAAVILTGCLTNPYSGGALADVVNKLIANSVRNVIVYAYKLWNNNHKEVVRKHFPSVFQHIFDGDCMTIINNQNNQALVLEPKTSKARGDGHYKSSNKSGWKIIPICVDNDVLFKLYNVDSDMYLQLSPTAGEDGVGQACGSKDEELSDKFYFEPLIIMNGQVAFNIFNDENNKRLELPVDVDTSEVKAVVGHKSVDSDQDERSSWILTTSSQDKPPLFSSPSLQVECFESFLSDFSVKCVLSEDEEVSNIYNYD